MSASRANTENKKRVALVSGSSRGIGRGIAMALARSGYMVFVNGRTDAIVATTVKEIEAEGGRARALVSDLTRDDRAQDAIKKVLELEGQLDLLVLNLGSGRTPNDWNPPAQEMRRVFDVNFFSAVALTSAALQLMKPGSNIVFIASIAGVEALGAPIAYSSAKTALLSYAKTLSVQAAPKGIRVNSVSPGNVLFEGSTWDDKIKKDEAAVKQYIKDQVPLNGFATPNDIAQAVTFLVSSPFVTGHNLVVDGGQTRKPI